MADPAQGPSLVLVLHNNLDVLTTAMGNAVDEARAKETASRFAGLLRDVAVELCGFREFSHVEFLEVSRSYESGDVDSPLALVLGSPVKDEDGQLIGVTDVQHWLDVLGALTASTALPAIIASKVGLDDEGMLGFSDVKLAKSAKKFNDRLNLESRFPELFSEEDEVALSDALGALMPEDSSELSPVHPEDLLSILAAFLFEAAGPPPRRTGPGFLQQAQHLAGGLLHAPRGLIRTLGNSTRSLRYNAWRLEEFAVSAAKVTVKVARKAARPVIIALVLRRALQTIDAAQNVQMRIARLPPAEAMDLYYRTLLGDDFNEQIEQDMLDAVKDVQDGFNTDDYKDEKRLLTAVMLRRLEVEEWDKERMKHFYYGSYGMGPWYFDMEERLHNPYFVGARAWNGPIEGWVGKNKTYPNDMPNTDLNTVAIQLAESRAGDVLTPQQRERISCTNMATAADVLTAQGGLLDGVLPAKRIQDYVTRQ
mmetsp:Transcript_2727/g.4714  ORF Transcript_2727/g.4714 Transcript_2727/m.4714 type:complete len:480 (-) Transcript_2727:401-1840(-)|eukprot:CAMPEP_0119107200 /NCGR_PEP_ID=MMETSP1180-20130426/9351_1 /TAXON_ID=3052 ORGANISM="Chlamydomonas cf sp, Strain CCMP681" /NCGR_SAMPLE_ID=MMETSP1180 /ASSEMBLY_ACC=CAM_ASM_000741 /LENGTH=479 /DNA_ID=CAMNT_0007092657 /DNA_START=72 /DNA_END=1511 /DNA_ORIENTATION=+